MFLVQPKFKHDTIIVGSTLAALIYAHYYRIPFLSATVERPDDFDWFPEHIDLTHYGLKAGCLRNKLWDKLWLELGVLGLNLVGDKSKAIRIQDDILKVSTKIGRIAKYQYNNLLIFSENGVDGLIPVKSSPMIMYKIIDSFAVRVDKHPKRFLGKMIDFNKVENVFLESIFIKKKIAYGISYLSEVDLHRHDYSEVQARFKLIKTLKDNGFRGESNGKDPGRKDGIRRYAVRAEHLIREKIKISRNMCYEDTETIKFKYESDIWLLETFSQYEI